MKFARRIALLSVLAAAACSKAAAENKPEAARPPATTAAAAQPAATKNEPAMGGELDVKLDDEHATKLRIGAAFVDLLPGDQVDDKPTSYKFFVRVFNDGAKDASCETKLDGHKPVGGSNWAL